MSPAITLCLVGDGGDCDGGNSPLMVMSLEASGMPIIRVLPEAFAYTPNNTLTTVVTVAIVATSSNGGFLDYLIEMMDGTESQIETGQVFFIVNWNAVIQAHISRLVRQQLTSAGTLESTWSITPASPSVVSVTVSTSLTPSAGFPRITYNIHNLSRQEMTV